MLPVMVALPWIWREEVGVVVPMPRLPVRVREPLMSRAVRGRVVPMPTLPR